MAVPLAALGFVNESDAPKVKPLVWTVRVVTSNHITIGHILAEAIQGLADPLLIGGGH